MRINIDANQILSEGKLVDRALRAGVREALLRHRQLGQPMVEWRNGKLVFVAPDEIPQLSRRSRTKPAGRSATAKGRPSRRQGRRRSTQ